MKDLYAERSVVRALPACLEAGREAVVGAGFNGVSFLDYGHAFSSMIMAGLWALALACYLAGAILAARQLGGRSRFRTQLR